MKGWGRNRFVVGDLVNDLMSRDVQPGLVIRIDGFDMWIFWPGSGRVHGPYALCYGSDWLSKLS